MNNRFSILVFALLLFIAMVPTAPGQWVRLEMPPEADSARLGVPLVQGLAATDSVLFMVGVYNDSTASLFRTRDLRQWELVDSAFFSSVHLRRGLCRPITVDNEVYIASNDDHIYRLPKEGQKCLVVGDGIPKLHTRLGISVDRKGGLRGPMLASIRGQLYCASDSSFYRLDSVGAKWDRVETNLPPMMNVALCSRDDSLFIYGTRGVARSSDGGQIWSGEAIGPPSGIDAEWRHAISDMLVFDGYIIVDHPSSGIARYDRITDDFTQIEIVDPNNSLRVDGHTIYATGSFNRIYTSNDEGQGWQSEIVGPASPNDYETIQTPVVRFHGQLLVALTTQALTPHWIWTRPYSEPPLGVREINSRTRSTEWVPNPTREESWLEIDDRDAIIVVTDIQGRAVSSSALNLERSSNGTRVSLRGDRLAPGIYQAHVISRGQLIDRRLTIVP